MSSITIQGFFAVKDGARDTTTTHCRYSTVIACEKSAPIPAILRIFTKSSANPFPNFTILFVIGKLAFTTSSGPCIDAIFCAPIKGDPASDSYEDGVPDFDIPIVIGVGHVSTTNIQLRNDSGDGTVKGFHVVGGSFVNGAVHTFTLHGSFDNTSRWNNVSPPRSSSAIAFVGLCHSFTSGVLRLSIADITFNISPQLMTPTPSDSSPDAVTASGKRRRFAASAPSIPLNNSAPSTPVQPTSTSSTHASAPLAGPSGLQSTSILHSGPDPNMAPFPAAAPQMAAPAPAPPMVVPATTQLFTPSSIPGPTMQIPVPPLYAPTNPLPAPIPPLPAPAPPFPLLLSATTSPSPIRAPRTRRKKVP